MRGPLEHLEEYQGPGGTYSFWRTGDGSPTVSSGTAGAPGECMHHSDGALSETLYIYGTAIEHALRAGWAPRFLVVGLGLGMIEMTLAAIRARDGADDSQLTVTSFESDDLLRDCFRRWVEGRDGDVPAPFARAYSAVSDALTAKFGLAGPRSIRERLRDWLGSDRLRLAGALGASSPLPADRASAILFDAYSRTTSPELWDEAFLVRFLGAVAAPEAVLATYAAQGNLKRALHSTGFGIEKRAGFSGKRESTFAVRSSRAATE